MSLASLHMGDAIRHVQGCQFPDNASLDPANEAVLSPQNQIQVLLRQMCSEPLAKKTVHAFKVQVELLVEIWRVDGARGILVLITSEEP